MKTQSFYVVVDKKDRIIGYKPKNGIRRNDICRTTGLLLVNKKGEVLVAQRSWAEAHGPGKWGPSAAGTVEKGESYRSNIIKEAREELGVSLRRVKTGPKIFVKGKYTRFTQRFFAKCDLPIEKFRLQKSEVAAVRWLPVREIRRLVKKKPSIFFGSASRWEKVLRCLSRAKL